MLKFDLNVCMLRQIIKHMLVIQQCEKKGCFTASLASGQKPDAVVGLENTFQDLQHSR